MQNPVKLSEALDRFESEHGPIEEDRSELLKKAKFHFQAFSENADRLSQEADESEREHLRGVLQYHREKLELLLSN